MNRIDKIDVRKSERSVYFVNSVGVVPPIRDIRVTCLAGASRLAVALCEGWLAQADPRFLKID
jgi:hypothetical protein